MKKVAVVTSTIGRKTLLDTIESVKKQTVPCRHYVFVHGTEFHKKAKDILQHHSDVEAIYLPNNNGNPNYGMAPVYAAAPYIVSEDYIFYLDDDNFFETNHVQSLVEHIENHQLDWAFSLRRIVADDGKYICDDDCESLGYFSNLSNTNLVDNSCFALKTVTAREHASSWYYPVVSDRKFMAALFEGKKRCGCTGLATVNYRLSKDGSNSVNAETFLKCNERMKELLSGQLPWRKPSINGYQAMHVQFV